MLDLHCHILFDVDDGAPTIETAVEMGRLLAAAGFTRVAASPHLGMGPGGDVSPSLAAARRDVLQARLAAEHIPLQLLPNAEHHVTPELYGRLRAGEGVSVGGASSWLLVELPWQGIVDPESALFRLQVAGYRLLLAHPERYNYLSLDTCERLVSRGIKLQLELGSFMGAYGSRAEQRVHALVERNLGHVLATDLHRPKQAEIWLNEALDSVRRQYGASALARGTVKNPDAMVADADADAILPLLESSTS